MDTPSGIGNKNRPAKAAKLARLSGAGERILVLYGQGHPFLLRDFIRQATI